MVVRPGFVKTRMTRGLPVPPLATDPETVARVTVRGLQRGAADRVGAGGAALGDGARAAAAAPAVQEAAAMSSRPRHSVGTGARAPGRAQANGHTPAEGWTPVEYNRPAYRRESAPVGRSGSVQHRRAAAARARRKRLLLIDLALGLALALAAIVIAPGLAIVAILALIGLLACAGSLAYGRTRQRKAARETRAPLNREARAGR